MKKKLKLLLLSSLLATSLGACDINSNKPRVENKENNVALEQEKPKEPTTTTSTNTTNDILSESELKNIKILPEVQEMVLNVIKDGIKSGEIKENQYTVDELLLFSKIFSKAIEDNKADLNSDLFKIISEYNLISNSKPTVVEDKTKDIDVFDSNESKILADLIKSKIPGTIVNNISKIKGTKFFATYINNSDIPLFTDKYNKYFLLYNINGKSVFLNDNGEQLSDQKDYVKIYKDIIDSIDKSILVKSKFGKGEKKLFVFTDPDCPFCNKLDNEIFNNLTASDNVTIYYVMMPLLGLHPDAGNKAAKILCSDDKDSSWKKWQLNKTLPDVDVTESCLNLVKNQFIYGEILGLNTTPTIINQNGITIEGALDVVRIRALIDLKAQ